MLADWFTSFIVGVLLLLSADEVSGIEGCQTELEAISGVTVAAHEDGEPVAVAAE